MNRIILRVFSILLFCIFGITAFSVAFAVYNGTAETLILFFKMFVHPGVVIDYPGPAAYTSTSALIQIFIIWIFYYGGRKLWAKSLPTRQNEEVLERTETKIDM